MYTITDKNTSYGPQYDVWFIYELNTLNNMIDNNMTAALISDVGYRVKKLDVSYEMITKLIHYCSILKISMYVVKIMNSRSYINRLHYNYLTRRLSIIYCNSNLL